MTILNIYYDEEGDFLELCIGSKKGGTFKNLGKGIFKRIDDKTNKITGIAIHGFKKRTKGNKISRLNIPLKLELSS